MFQRRQRRFKRRSNGSRGHLQHIGNQTRLRSNSFTNGQGKNNFRTTLSAEKLFEKYSSLAKEALSSGEKTLSENYLQHADHFLRVIEDKNRNSNQSKDNSIIKSTESPKSLSEGVTIEKNDNSKSNK